MKKRLLMVAFAALSVASSFAYEVGEYVYTATQRVKISGENIVKNGDFSEGTEGWTNAAAESLNADVWSFVEGEGPNGENAISSINSTTADAALCSAWQIPADGTYLVTYDIKGGSLGVTGLVTGGTSCVDIFLTEATSLTKGEGDVSVSTVDGYKDFWKSNAYTFTATSSQSLVMHVEKLAANTMITNIQIYPVDIVYDDRIIKSKLEYVDKLLATQKFLLDTENGFVANIVEALRGMLQEEGALDDPSSVEGMMGEFDNELLAWLNLNAADLLKNETKWSAYGDTRKMNGIGGNWKGTGGRWFHKNNGGSTELTEDGDEIGFRFQGGFEGNCSQYYTIVPENPGTYMFSLDIVGHYMCGTTSKQNYLTGTNDQYLTDWNRDFKGATIYVGKDVMGADAEANAAMNIEQEGQKVDCGVISNPNAKVNPQKFAVFYEVSQEMVDAKTPISFGMTYILDPDKGVTNYGTNVNIANPQIRLIGVAQELIDYQNEVKAIITQQGPLKDRLQYVRDDMQKTATEGYPWRHDTLTIALEKHQPIYEASLRVIDIEGNVVDEAKIKEIVAAANAGESILLSDSLLKSVQALNGVRNYFSNINKPIADYRTKIADAEAVRDDDMNAMCNPKIIQDAIDAANAKLTEVLATTTDETREADQETLNAQLEELAKAVEAFKADAPLTPVVDIDFFNKAEAQEEGDIAFIIKGTKGQMEFTSFEADNTVSGSTAFQQGHSEELIDVLRVGNGSAVVNLAEADQASDEEVIRFNFDMWYGNLSGKAAGIELQNAAGERIAGFSMNRYNGTVDYNDFNNSENTGIDLLKYVTGIGSKTESNVAICTDANKSSFNLIVDYKAQTIQGIVINGKNGTCTGEVMPFRSDITDNKIVKFVVKSNYNNSDRRCWFDNLKAFKYASKAEGPHQFGTLGDVNGDGKIDVEDVVAIVNKILGEPAENFLEAYADVTGDGKIDVDDVVAVVNIILGGSDAAAAAPQLMNILLQNGFKF